MLHLMGFLRKGSAAFYRAVKQLLLRRGFSERVVQRSIGP